MKSLIAILMLFFAMQGQSAILATDQPFSYERATKVHKGMTPEQVNDFYLREPTTKIFFRYEQANIHGVVWEYLDMLGNTIRIYFRCASIDAAKNVCTGGKVYKTSTDYDTWLDTHE